MDNTDMFNLWKTFDKKLEESLVLNRKNATDITSLKVRSFITSMTPLKIFTIVVGLFWVGFVDTLILVLFHIASPFFLVSAVIQVVLTKLAIGIYLYQLVLIHGVNINAPVLETQKKLAELQSSTMWVVRILFLQLPIWTTFYLSPSIFQSGNILFCVIQLLITGLFTYISIWLFVNIKYENKDKKWFRCIFAGKEWKPLMKSMDMLQQVEEYEKESGSQ